MYGRIVHCHSHCLEKPDKKRKNKEKTIETGKSGSIRQLIQSMWKRLTKKKINNPKNIQRGKHTGDEIPVFYCICCCPVQGKKGRAGGQTKRFCKTGKLDELDQVGKIPK